jgi:hypothetical protein
MLTALETLPLGLTNQCLDRLEHRLLNVRFQQPNALFSTYGLPAYQCDRLSQTYRAQAHRCNPLLLRKFEDLYGEVLLRIERIFAAPVRFHSQLSVPGLHYFSSDALDRFGVGGIHYDYSFSKVDWEYCDRPVEQFWSVVVVLENPAFGATIDFYKDKARPLDGYFPENYCANTVEIASSIALESGSLAIFNGLQLHRIGASKTTSDLMSQGRPRITMQGHLYPIDGELIFFW